MPYKDKGKQREANRLAKQRVRGMTQGMTKEGMTGEGMTHPVMKYLIPGEDRKKMERIVKSLKSHNQLENVYLGCGKTSLPLDVVGEMLEVTG